MKKISAILCVLLGGAFCWAITVSTTSPNLGITFMSPNEAQPHLTFNDLVSKLDGLVMPVIKVYPADPDPVVNAPEEGDMFIVPAGATGDWAGEDNNLALYINESWAFFTPQVGWVVDVAPQSAFLYRSRPYVYANSGWIPYAIYQYISKSESSYFYFGSSSSNSATSYALMNDTPSIYLEDSDGNAVELGAGRILSRDLIVGDPIKNESTLDSDTVLSVSGAINVSSSISAYNDPYLNGSAKIYVDYSSGDLMVKLKFGDVTKTATLVDFSAL